MKPIELWHGDCLELMKNIPDGSVDMILCDLPYGTMKGAQLDGWKNQTTEWDNVIDTEKLFAEYERVLRMNGVAVLFSQEPYTSHLRTYKAENFLFLYPMIWKKDHFANALVAKKAPVSYFEDLSVFSKKYDKQNLHPLREYFKIVLEYIGVSSCKEINNILGHRRAEHCFYVTEGKRIARQNGQKIDHATRTGSSQFGLCTERTYQELTDRFNLENMQGYKTFDELETIDRTFKRTFKRTFNLQDGKKYMGNVLEFKKDYTGMHPTQKPVALLEYLIKTYTNKGETVLDNCMGSGSTGVACVNTGRKFIGIELDVGYFNIAKKRIEEAYAD